VREKVKGGYSSEIVVRPELGQKGVSGNGNKKPKELVLGPVQGRYDEGASDGSGHWGQEGKEEKKSAKDAPSDFAKIPGPKAQEKAKLGGEGERRLAGSSGNGRHSATSKGLTYLKKDFRKTTTEERGGVEKNQNGESPASISRADRQANQGPEEGIWRGAARVSS